MEKITESIDLTLDSIFAGDENQKLLPVKWRNRTHRNENILGFVRNRITVMDLEIEIIGEWIGTECEYQKSYFNIFGVQQADSFEESFRNECPRCGKETDFFTRIYEWGCCNTCENTMRYEDDRMSIL